MKTILAVILIRILNAFKILKFIDPKSEIVKYVRNLQRRLALFVAKGSKDKNSFNRQVVRSILFFPTKFICISLVTQLVVLISYLELPVARLFLSIVSLFLLFLSLMIMHPEDFYSTSIVKAKSKAENILFYALYPIVCYLPIKTGLVEIPYSEIVGWFLVGGIIILAVIISFLWFYIILNHAANFATKKMIRVTCWLFRLGLVKTPSTPFRIFSLRI